MKDFKNINDQKLLRWIELYELIPNIRFLFSVEEYKEAIIEAYKRFEGNEMHKYCYFVYINAQGDLDDYKSWFKRLQGELL